MQEISTLENDIKGIKEAIDAKNAPMMVSSIFSWFSLFNLRRIGWATVFNEFSMFVGFRSGIG